MWKLLGNALIEAEANSWLTKDLYPTHAESAMSLEISGRDQQRPSGELVMMLPFAQLRKVEPYMFVFRAKQLIATCL